MIFDAIKRVRKNHALEHAAVTLLLERGIRPPLGGYSSPGGFWLFTRASAETVEEVVSEAFNRLKGGEAELAVSPYCGTNLATGMMLAAFVSSLIMGRRKGKRRMLRAPFAVAGAAVGMVWGKRLGNDLQRRYTTLADLGDLEVSAIRRVWPLPFSIYRVDTRSGS